MNDKIIINAISKIYAAIISFLLFIFFISSVVFVVLQNGLYLEKVKLPNLNIEKLYIKWNEKLSISAKEIIITKRNTQKKQIQYKDINNIFKKIILFDSWIERVDISQVNYNGIHAEFKYIEGAKGFLDIHTDETALHSSLYFDKNFFHVKLNDFTDSKRNIIAYGDILINMDHPEILSYFNLNVNNDLKTDVYINAQSDKLYYTLKPLKRVTNVKNIINMFKLPKNLQYWARDAIGTDSLNIRKLYGSIDYDKVAQAYKTVYIDASAEKMSYKYNPKLDPIHSKTTHLVLKEGILYIHPDEASTYNMPLDKSWLKIDFTKPHETLTLYLLFQGQLNSDILNILNSYKIHLPFKQNSGLVDTNLKLQLDLSTLDVDVIGEFYAKKANFTYLGLDLDIDDGYISLQNNDVNIKNMHCDYKDIASAFVDVKLDVKKNLGFIDFAFEKIAFKDVGLSLLQKKKYPLKVHYAISPKHDVINTTHSLWKFQGQTIALQGSKIEFNLKELRATVPKTYINIPGMFQATIAGEGVLRPYKFNFDVDLLSLAPKNISLQHRDNHFKLRYKNSKFSLTPIKEIPLLINDIQTNISHFRLTMQQQQLKISDTEVTMEDLVHLKFNSQYDLKKQNGTLNIKKLEVRSDEYGEIFKNNFNVPIYIDKVDNSFVISSQDLNTSFSYDRDVWKLTCDSLERASKYSKFLEKYKLTNGKITLYKNRSEKNIKFLATTDYPYQILIEKNKPITTYILSGEYSQKLHTIDLNVNNSLKIHLNKEIHIYTENSGINIDAIIDMINDSSSKTSAKGMKLVFESNNSYFFIAKNREIISDTFHMNYENNTINATLKHANAEANFAYKDGEFHIYGENFNDRFMDKLFSLARFKGGKLSFEMGGKLKEYSGVFYLEDTTIIDYKILNNILAFINTIPSLVTFNVPGYNKSGLGVNSAYLNFHLKDDVLNISDVYLDSKELDILGRGTASFVKNSIDLKLNLKTDLGSNLSKIPLVGYILLGKDSISTTLSITGALNNPKVESMLAQDIVVAPLNIIKRTLLLPYHLLGGDKED